ncbi:MAG: FkbM family methyltransferase [Rhodocyclaceae bacterium]|nr:FkbM family methyltransferase [Rhodocyclaceae bacterium]
MKIIYDVGANNGCNIPYYLLKSDLVVAIEANPSLCDFMRQRFAAQIQEGRLVVENFVVSVEDSSRIEVPFYLHKYHHVLSQFPRPPSNLIENFDRVYLPSSGVVQIIRKYGEPYYVKIDIEYYDEPILRSLFNAGIMPPYISAESHHPEVFCTLVALGGYRKFKLVDGPSVKNEYKKTLVKSGEQMVEYSFRDHSAGPFGEDVNGPWLDSAEFLSLLGSAGMGWKDIHGSNIVL